MDGSTNANSVTTAPPPPRRYDPATMYLTRWQDGRRRVFHWRGPGPYVIWRATDGSITAWWTVEETAMEWSYFFTVEGLMAHVLNVVSVPRVEADASLPEAA